MGRGKSPVYGQEIKLIGKKYENYLLVQHTLRRDLEEKLAEDLERYKLELAKSVALCVGDNNKMARIADSMGVSHTTAQKYYQLALDNDLMMEAIKVKPLEPFTFEPTDLSRIALSAADDSEFPILGVRLSLPAPRAQEWIITVNGLMDYNPRVPAYRYPSVQKATAPHEVLDSTATRELLLEEKNIKVLRELDAWFDPEAALAYLRANPTIEEETAK